jgi:hypothetical protein
LSAEELLRSTQGQPQVTFYSGSTATDPDGTTATVTVTRGDGTALATNAATVRDGVGVYHYVLAPQANLDYLSLDWTGTFGGVSQTIRTYVEIVGEFFVPLADIRALEGLSNTTTFPDQTLKEARYWFMELAQSVCGVSFVPRYARDVMDGDGSKIAFLSHRRPRKLLSASVGGTTVSDLTKWHLYPRGRLVRDDGTSFPSGFGNVVVTYEHGYDAPDWELRQAALLAIRWKVLGDRSAIPPNASNMTTEDAGYAQNLQPSLPTGIPEVDDALARRRGSLAVVM